MQQIRILLKISILIFLIQTTNGKNFCDRYDLAIELYRGGLTNIDVWICIIGKVSGYQTDLISNVFSPGTRLFGIFQFFEPIWCEYGRKGRGCNMDCRQFLDDDLRDDIRCAKHIYDVEGISAWENIAKQCYQNITYLFNDCV